MKVSFVNKKLFKEFAQWLGTIASVFSFVLIFYEIPNNWKIPTGIIVALILLFTYLFLWYKANKVTAKHLCINGMDVTIKVGDIFSSQGLKIIPFNEYFDTKVDDFIISTKTLNGKYLLNYCNDIDALDNKISNDVQLTHQIVEVNTSRTSGKSIRYKLGSICKDGDYLLLAFSKFDKQNRAYLDPNNFINCLFNMWNELDILHNGYDIYLPLIGTGLTRTKGISLSEQEILEFILFTLKTSGITFGRKSKINILIYENDIDKIDLYSLKD